MCFLSDNFSVRTHNAEASCVSCVAPGCVPFRVSHGSWYEVCGCCLLVSGRQSYYGQIYTQTFQNKLPFFFFFFLTLGTLLTRFSTNHVHRFSALCFSSTFSTARTVHYMCCFGWHCPCSIFSHQAQKMALCMYLSFLCRQRKQPHPNSTFYQDVRNVPVLALMGKKFQVICTKYESIYQ